jgi:hypothetical protein
MIRRPLPGPYVQAILNRGLNEGLGGLDSFWHGMAQRKTCRHRS